MNKNKDGKRRKIDSYPAEERVEHLLHRLLTPISVGHQNCHVLLQSSTGHRIGVVGRHFEQSVGDVGQPLRAKIPSQLAAQHQSV